MKRCIPLTKIIYGNLLYGPKGLNVIRVKRDIRNKDKCKKRSVET